MALSPLSLQAAAPHLGAATPVSGNPGNSAAAMTEVRNAIEMLQRALPNIPMGSKLHSAVLKSTESISKELGAAAQNPQLQTQSLLAAIREMSQTQPNKAVQGLFQQNPAAGPAMPSPPTPAAPPPGMAA